MERSSAGVGASRRCALKQHLAAGRRMDAREDLDDGRFARAVLAQKRVESARLQLQIDVAERNGRAKSLGDVAQLQKRNADLKLRRPSQPESRADCAARGRAVRVESSATGRQCRTFVFREILAIALACRLLLQFFGRQLRAEEPHIVGQVGLNEVLESLGGDDLRRDFDLLTRLAGQCIDHVQGAVDGDVRMVADDVRTEPSDWPPTISTGHCLRRRRSSGSLLDVIALGWPSLRRPPRSWSRRKRGRR